MSDRKENRELYVHESQRGPGESRRASPADLLAVVRRGVESGTIKGEVVRVNRNGTVEGDLLPGSYLVIPVSDGGSET